MKALCALSVACLLAVPPLLHAGAVIREPGAIYLEDLVAQPVKLATSVDTPIYYKSDLGRYLGTLRKGQVVEVQAVSDVAYRVLGQAQQGQVAGWVDPKVLTPLRKEFLVSLKQNAARKEEVQALIAKSEVAINMTPEEVMAALGKPGKKTSHLDATHREDTWEFVRYERVPKEISGYDRYGNIVTSITYVKVPAGKISVTFSNNLVASLEQSEGTLDRDSRVKIVTAPLSVVY